MLQHIGEWTSNGAVVVDESSIKVRETQEMLKFFDCGWHWPVLPLVHLDATIIYDIAKELH